MKLNNQQLKETAYYSSVQPQLVQSGHHGKEEMFKT